MSVKCARTLMLSGVSGLLLLACISLLLGRVLDAALIVLFLLGAGILFWVGAASVGGQLGGGETRYWLRSGRIRDGVGGGRESRRQEGLGGGADGGTWPGDTLRPGREIPVAQYPQLLAEVTQSRREIVSAFEIERHRIERDLHDGAQQYVVAANMKLGEANLEVDPKSPIGQLLGAAQDDIECALRALRQTVHGISAQTLTDLGLEAAIRDLVTRFPNARLRCPHPLPGLSEGIVAVGYFFTSEALSNTGKYAPDAVVTILLTCDQVLRITVTDDGDGGAVICPGHGLSGMRERLAAFGGSLTISSPSGGPTQLSAEMPLLLQLGESGIATTGGLR